MTITHDTMAQPSYDPETGAWDGQLAHADLVDQLPPPTHPLPDLDNTVKTLFYWAMDLDIPHGPRLALLTIIRHIDWKEGSGCRASLPTLAKEAQFSTKTLKAHISLLVQEKIITRHRRMSQASETRLSVETSPTMLVNTTTKPDKTRHSPVGVETSPTVGVETSPTVGVETTPTSWGSGNASNQSSSNQSLNQREPRTDDTAPKGRVSSRAEQSSKEVPSQIGVTDGGSRISSQEEERTGTGTEDYQAFQDFVDRHLSEVPTDSEIEPLAKHCWPEWGPHWGGGWAAAWPTWTKDIAGRKKFRSDVVAHLAKVGLPKPMAPDADNDRARELSAAWMDQRIAEAPKRAVKCAICGERRELPPGQLLCQPCRKTLVEIT